VRMTPVLRALSLVAAIVALCAVGLLVNRWHASRALDSARARSEALGLRLDPAAIAREQVPEARATVLAAEDLCVAIDARAAARDDAEMAAGEYSADRLDALTRDEAYRDAEALEAAATRFLAAGVADHPRAGLGQMLAAIEDDDPERRVESWRVRWRLVERLCGAARVTIAGGDTALGWRRIELAARVCATQRGTDMLGVSAIALMMRELRAADLEAAVVAADDPARERVRVALRDLDVMHEARAALRSEASVMLSLVDEFAALGATHGLHLRLVALDLRDRAMVHHTWAGIIEASELSSAADQRAALAAIDARMKTLPRTYALTLLTMARALSFWEHAQATEAARTALVGE